MSFEPQRKKVMWEVCDRFSHYKQQNGESLWIHFVSPLQACGPKEKCLFSGERLLYKTKKTQKKKKIHNNADIFLVSNIVSVLLNRKKNPTPKFFPSQQQSPLFISVWMQPSLPEFQFLTQSPLWSLRVASLRGPYGEQPAIRVRKPVSGSELKPLQYLKAIFCLFGGFNP